MATQPAAVAVAASSTSFSTCVRGAVPIAPSCFFNLCEFASPRLMPALAAGVLFLCAMLPAQIGWQKDAPMGRTLANGMLWCDTSVTPNECFAFGGSENTINVSRYFKDGATWRWELTAHQAPAVVSGPLGSLQEHYGGRAEFLEKDSQGRDVNKALFISGTIMQFGGLSGRVIRKVWSFDRVTGFAPMVEKPLYGDKPPDDRDFTTAYVPFDPANPAGSGRIYRFGTYSGPIATATNDMWVLNRTAPGEVTWTRLQAMGNAPPPLAHATLTYMQGLLILSGGMRYELGAPINNSLWVTFPFPLGGRQLWIKIPDAVAPNVKWKGSVWSHSGLLCRFGSVGRYDRPTYNHFEVMIPGLTRWWRVPTHYARPEGRWMCSGAWIPSEQVYLLVGGIRVPGLNGGVDLHQDSWRFRL